MGFSSLKSNNPFRSHSSNNENVDDVPPPAGPPPSYAGAGSGPGDYAPPPGPPPSYGGQQQGPGGDYAPPPGPPPSQQHGKKPAGGDDFAPPPGPPPSQQPQPQHNWQEAVPDTSGFPPPPDIFSGWDHSPATNASADQAEAGEAWCRRYPLSPPLDLNRAEPGLRQRGIVPRLITPPAGLFRGGSLTQSSSSGSWSLSTDKRGGDVCVIGYPHVYLVQRDSPLATGQRATIYFECHVKEMGRDAGFAVGFSALPYPPFR